MKVNNNTNINFRNKKLKVITLEHSINPKTKQISFNVSDTKHYDKFSEIPNAIESLKKLYIERFKIRQRKKVSPELIHKEFTRFNKNG